MARLHSVPLRNAKRLQHTHAEALNQPPPEPSAAIQTKRLAKTTKLSSLNYELGCIKVNDTFRNAIPSNWPPTRFRTVIPGTTRNPIRA
jgi:hypothetical protein